MSPAFDDNSKFVKFLLPVGKTLETFLQRLFLPLLLPGESLTPREKKKNRRIIHATHSLLASPAILIPLPSPFSSFSFFLRNQQATSRDNFAQCAPLSAYPGQIGMQFILRLPG